MPKQGRDFEQFVHQLELVLAEGQHEIKSPDFIEDKDTGTKREIDVTVRGKLGSHEVLIAIECRDRKSTEDVTWIEQIASKRNSIGAHKMIAVSSSGFSDGAKNKAKQLDIELRDLKTFKPEEVKSMFQNFEVKIIRNLFHLVHVNFDFQLRPKQRMPRKKSFKFKPDQKFIKNAVTGERISPNDVFLWVNRQEDDKFFRDLEINAEPILGSLRVNVEKPAELQVRVGASFYHLKHIDIIVSLRKMEFNIPFKEMKQYSKEDGIIAETGIYKGQVDNDRECEFQFFTNLPKKDSHVVSVKISQTLRNKKK